jgi:cyclic pyranopterin phosphate synthase
VYCTPPEGVRHFRKEDVLTDDEIVRFVRIARKQGLNKVRITGGEPLLRKNIIRLISSIKEIGISDLSLTTNGIILSKMAGELKQAGLDRVNISLDTMKQDRFRQITGGGSIEQVWESIREAENVGLSPVKINVVPIRGINDDEILNFVLLTLGRDFHVRFIEFMPASCNAVWSKDKYVSSSEIMERISSLGNIEKLRFRGKGPSRNFRIKGAKGVIGIISPISDHFCKYCNRLRLTADGKIRPCLFSSTRIDLKTPMRCGASDEEIEKLFIDSVKIKPKRHMLNDNRSSIDIIRSMSKIGG